MIRILTVLWTLFWLGRISAEDIRSFTIPNRYMLAILPAAPFLSSVALPLRILAALLPAVLIPLMGMGDVKLYGALGFCLGPAALLQIACASMLAGGVCAGILVMFKKAKKKDRIPFGPFIAAAAAVYYFLVFFVPFFAPFFPSTSAM